MTATAIKKQVDNYLPLLSAKQQNLVAKTDEIDHPKPV